MKRHYRLTLIVKPETEILEKQASEIVSSLVDENITFSGIKVENKKSLTYHIKKLNTGTFIYADLEGNAIRVHDIEKRVQLKPEIVRFLLTSKK
jgi:ribosomal protein S6